MKHLRRLALAAFVPVLAASTIFACLWDTDTLSMERERFPSVLELITGRFLRHSNLFYRWRIKNRLNRIKTAPGDLKLHDDLAVAYDKTHQNDKAIATMEAILANDPDRYKTLATKAVAELGDVKATEAFLKALQADYLDANEVYANALSLARKTNRRVFVHLGAPW